MAPGRGRRLGGRPIPTILNCEPKATAMCLRQGRRPQPSERVGIRFGPIRPLLGQEVPLVLPGTSRPPLVQREYPPQWCGYFPPYSHNSFAAGQFPHQMAKRFRKTTRYTRSRGNSRTIRRTRRYQRKATARMASVQYHTFTLVN